MLNPLFSILISTLLSSLERNVIEKTITNIWRTDSPTEDLVDDTVENYVIQMENDDSSTCQEDSPPCTDHDDTNGGPKI